MVSKTVCEQHGTLMQDIGELRGTMKGLGKNLDQHRIETRSGINEIKGQLQAISQRESKQNGAIQDVTMKIERGGGALSLVKTVIPWILTVISLGAAIAFGIMGVL